MKTQKAINHGTNGIDVKEEKGFYLIGFEQRLTIESINNFDHLFALLLGICHWVLFLYSVGVSTTFIK